MLGERHTYLFDFCSTQGRGEFEENDVDECHVGRCIVKRRECDRATEMDEGSGRGDRLRLCCGYISKYRGNALIVTMKIGYLR